MIQTLGSTVWLERKHDAQLAKAEAEHFRERREDLAWATVERDERREAEARTLAAEERPRQRATRLVLVRLDRDPQSRSVVSVRRGTTLEEYDRVDGSIYVRIVSGK